MKVSEVINKWAEASSVADVKGSYVRNGNWEPISRALRHFKDDTATVEVVAEGVLKVIPTEPKHKEGEPAVKGRPAFHIAVR